jgi:hypothetical protein
MTMRMRKNDGLKEILYKYKNTDDEGTNDTYILVTSEEHHFDFLFRVVGEQLLIWRRLDEDLSSSICLYSIFTKR